MFLCVFCWDSFTCIKMFVTQHFQIDFVTYSWICTALCHRNGQRVLDSGTTVLVFFALYNFCSFIESFPYFLCCDFIFKPFDFSLVCKLFVFFMFFRILELFRTALRCSWEFGNLAKWFPFHPAKFPLLLPAV